MKQTRLTSQTLILASIGFSSMAFGSKFNVELSIGADSNLYNFADEHQPTWQAETLLNVGWEHKLQQVRLDIDADLNWVNDERAEEEKFMAEIGLFQDDGIHRWDVAASATQFDKTYVSKTTTEIATSNDILIPDRYDYSEAKFTGEYGFHGYNRWMFTHTLEGRDRNYTPVEGLSNYDYRQASYEYEHRYKVKSFKWTFTNLNQYRWYDSKPPYDLNGDTIAGNALSLWMIEFDNKIRWSQGMLNLELELDYQYTYDESGYYQNHQLAPALDIEIQKERIEWFVSGKLVDNTYIQRSSIVDFATDYWQVRTGWTQEFPEFEVSLAYQYKTQTSSDWRYVYDQHRIDLTWDYSFGY